MPMVDLTYPAGSLSAEARGRLAEQLTAAILRNEGAPDSKQARAMTWVFTHELPADAIHVSGVAAERPVYRLLITVPAGTLLHGPGPFAVASRRNLVREVTDAVLDAEGAGHGRADAARVYCLIREIEDGYWGSLGTTWRMEDIAALAGGAETPLAAEGRAAIEALLAQPVEAEAAR